MAEGSGGMDGNSRWPFNDRRFTLATSSQRLRSNLSNFMTDFQQATLNTAHQNPELMNQLRQQLHIISELVNGTPGPANVPPDSVVLQMDMFPPEPTGDAIEDGPGPTDDADEETEDVEAGGEEDGDQLQPADPLPENPLPDASADENEDWRRLIEFVQRAETRRILKGLLAVAPFVLVFLLKLFMEYLVGLMAFLLALFVFIFSNRLAIRFLGTRNEGRRSWDLLRAVMALCCWLAAFFYIFADQEIWRCLIFQPVPIISGHHVDLCDVFWVILTSVLVVKFVTILLKLHTGLWPHLMGCSLRRKRRLYQWLEYSSHLYSYCLPIRPWSHFLLVSSHWKNSFLRGIYCTLVLVYFLFKCAGFLSRLRVWLASGRCVFSGLGFGVSPSSADLCRNGPSCSICYGDLVRPVRLSCQHVFCEDCISTWLDKERTCPMCRAEVSQEDTSWKSGATSFLLDVY